MCLIEHPDLVHEVALSADGRRLLSYAGTYVDAKDGQPLPPALNSAIWLSDATTGEVMKKLDTPHVLQHLAFSSDGGSFLTAAAETPWDADEPVYRVGVYDAATFRPLRSAAVPGRRGRVAVDGRFTRILTSDLRNVRLFALPDAAGAAAGAAAVAGDRPLARFVAGEPWARPLALSPDGRYALAGSGGSGGLYGDERPRSRWNPGGDNTIVLWDLTLPPLPEVTFRLPPDVQIHRVNVSPDQSRLLLTLSDATARLVDVATGKELKRLDPEPVENGAAPRAPQRLWPGAGAVSPDGRVAAATLAKGKVCVWDAGTGKVLFTWDAGEKDEVWSLAFAADGTSLLAGSGRSQRPTVAKAAVAPVVIEVKTGRAVKHFTPAKVQGEGVWPDCMAVSPDGRWIATASTGTYYHKSQIVLWDAKTGAEVRRLRPAWFETKELRFAPNGLLASRTGDRVYVWDPAAGKLLATLDRMSDGVHSFAFTPDGSALASTWGRGRASLWHPTEGRLLQYGDSLGTGVSWGQTPRLVIPPDGKPRVVIENADSLVIAPVVVQ
jgi:WD40 repeat protein